MLELVETKGSPAVLKVIGVGGGGSNAVNRMILAGLADVEFWISNTDLQALEKASTPNRVQIGHTVTRGLGAGGDPEIGRISAEEDLEQIQRSIEGADMLFITAGMGGGTGTGAAPVIARVARELGILTVAIVTKPFAFEGKKKMKRALAGIDELNKQVDTLITIPNQKLMNIVEPGTSFDSALLMADEVLFQATRGISDLITGHGVINLDFADVRTVMRNRGNALLGSGSATGENRAMEAAQAAVSSPLLEEVSIDGAEALLINVQGGSSMGFHEAAEAAQFISDRVGEDADVFWGAVVDPSLEDEMRVTLVATGFARTDSPTRRGPEETAVPNEIVRGAHPADPPAGPPAGPDSGTPVPDSVPSPVAGGRGAPVPVPAVEEPGAAAPNRRERAEERAGLSAPGPTPVATARPETELAAENGEMRAAVPPAGDEDAIAVVLDTSPSPSPSPSPASSPRAETELAAETPEGRPIAEESPIRSDAVPEAGVPARDRSDSGSRSFDPELFLPERRRETDRPPTRDEDWIPRAETSTEETLPRNRNPLDVPTFMRKKIMD